AALAVSGTPAGTVAPGAGLTNATVGGTGVDVEPLLVRRLRVPGLVVGAVAYQRRRLHDERPLVVAPVRGRRLAAVEGVADPVDAGPRVGRRQGDGDRLRVPAARAGGAVAGDRARGRGGVDEPAACRGRPQVPGRVDRLHREGVASLREPVVALRARARMEAAAVELAGEARAP